MTLLPVVLDGREVGTAIGLSEGDRDGCRADVIPLPIPPLAPLAVVRCAALCMALCTDAIASSLICFRRCASASSTGGREEEEEGQSGAVQFFWSALPEFIYFPIGIDAC